MVTLDARQVDAFGGACRNEKKVWMGGGGTPTVCLCPALEAQVMDRLVVVLVDTAAVERDVQLARSPHRPAGLGHIHEAGGRHPCGRRRRGVVD